MVNAFDRLHEQCHRAMLADNIDTEQLVRTAMTCCENGPISTLLPGPGVTNQPKRVLVGLRVDFDGEYEYSNEPQQTLATPED